MSHLEQPDLSVQQPRRKRPARRAGPVKCSYADCPYGPTGDKTFKKTAFLKNHIKTVHEEKEYHCPKCLKGFGHKWQMKHHAKYCGTILRCQTCSKVYNKPTSLWMHCKRSKHVPAAGLEPKSARPKDSGQVVILPVVIQQQQQSKFDMIPEACDMPAVVLADAHPVVKHSKNKLILPRQNSIGGSSTTDNEESPMVALDRPPLEMPVAGSRSSSSSPVIKNTDIQKTETVAGCSHSKRSTDCQTAKRIQRRKPQHTESISIQTQTLHSSFDLPLADRQPSNQGQQKQLPPQLQPQQQMANGRNSPRTTAVKKCSFTQTFDFDDDQWTINGDSDPFLQTYPKSKSMEEEDQPGTENGPSCQNTETQTYWGEPFSSEFSDFSDFPEFVDIETQTIWNYDRTTQTDQLFSGDSPGPGHEQPDDWSGLLFSRP